MSVAEDFQVFLGKLEALKRMGELTPEAAQKLLATTKDVEDSNPELSAPAQIEGKHPEPAPKEPDSK